MKIYRQLFLFSFLLVSTVRLPVDSATPTVNSVNVILNPGDEACFFQYYPANDLVILEYKVISATYQDHVIGFQLSDALGRALISEFKKYSSSQFKTTEAGSYKMCLDNTHTRYSKKSVSLRLTRKDSDGTNWEEYNQANLAPEEDYGGKVSEFSGLIDKVRVALNEIQESQEAFRQLELRDRVIGEQNFSRVNWYSFACLSCTMLVMLLQVFSLRSFFDDKSAVQRFFKQRR